MLLWTDRAALVDMELSDMFRFRLVGYDTLILELEERVAERNHWWCAEGAGPILVFSRNLLLCTFLDFIILNSQLQ